MSEDLDPCPICRTSSPTFSTGRDSVGFDCPRCGKYILTGTAMSIVSNAKRGSEHKISGWIYDQNAAGSVPEISSYTLEGIAKLPDIKLTEKIDRLLLAFVRPQTTFGEPVTITDPKFISAIHGKDIREVYYVADALRKKGLVDSTVVDTKDERASINHRVEPEGYVYAETLTNAPRLSSQVFVAMWFDKTMDDAYFKGIEAAILRAKFSPLRIDKKEHVNKIDDEILAEIKQSRFLVADFTGHRGGVYFEAGYALGSGLPIIWTCKQDHIKDLHFDIRQYNCIDWTTPEELQERLFQRIRAIVGEGVANSNNH